jgi:hypothetical protein
MNLGKHEYRRKDDHFRGVTKMIRGSASPRRLFRFRVGEMDTTIDHKGSEIVLLFNGDGHDFISLPGTIRHKIPDEPGDGAFLQLSANIRYCCEATAPLFYRASAFSGSEHSCLKPRLVVSPARTDWSAGMIPTRRAQRLPGGGQAQSSLETAF